jgi:hypothetical protein
MRLLTAIVLLSLLALDAEAADIRCIDYSDASCDLIYIDGQIEKGDAVKFEELINADLFRFPYKVLLNSPGGNALDAMRIGKIIRTLFLRVEAPSRTYNSLAELITPVSPYAPDCEKKQCTCASACTLIWFAGIDRQGDSIGVHQPNFEKDYYKENSLDYIVGEHAKMIALSRSYLKEMGVLDDMINMFMTVPPNEMKFLTKEEIGPYIGMIPAIRDFLDARCGALTKSELDKREANRQLSLAGIKLSPKQKSEDLVFSIKLESTQNVKVISFPNCKKKRN